MLQTRTIKNKQKKITRKFKEFADSKKYETENVWIYYNSFKSAAMVDVNQKITAYEIGELLKKIDNPDIWNISKIYTAGTFFCIY